MAVFLGAIGMFGFPCCVIWLIVNAVRWDSKKPPLIGMLICAILFFGAGGMIESENETALPKDVKNQSTPSGREQSRGLPLTEESTSAPDVDDEPEGSVQTGDYRLPCGAKILFYDSVRNDVTGKWRRAGTTTSLPAMDFAIEYYETMFSSDDEIHAIWNATLNTTTKIAVSNNLLFVDTFEYVDGEEQDAKKMFSGALLDSQIIDLKTGQLFEEPEPVTELEVVTQAQKPQEKPESKPASTPATSTTKKPADTSTSNSSKGANDSTPSASGSGGDNSSNFYTYDNADQQKTDDARVLNTSTMKIHYPSCNEVKKIAPQNYSTSNLSESELINQGYKPCGKCH